MEDIDKKSKPESVIHVRVEAELYDQAKALAAKKGMNLSVFVRHLLITELEKAGLR